jgi:hypothetical protein
LAGPKAVSNGEIVGPIAKVQVLRLKAVVSLWLAGDQKKKPEARGELKNILLPLNDYMLYIAFRMKYIK